MTPLQTKVYWRKFNEACVSLGIKDKPAREAYRRSVMKDEAGVSSSKEIETNPAYDRIMARFCMDAGDYGGSCHYACGKEIRLAKLCKDCADKIFALSQKEGDADPVAYIRGILLQSRLMDRGYVYRPMDDWFMDIPENYLEKILAILDTHRRRLLKRLALADREKSG